MQTFLFHDDAATAGAATRRPTLLTARLPTAVAPDHCIEYALTLDAAGVHVGPCCLPVECGAPLVDSPPPCRGKSGMRAPGAHEEMRAQGTAASTSLPLVASSRPARGEQRARTTANWCWPTSCRSPRCPRLRSVPVVSLCVCVHGCGLVRAAGACASVRQRARTGRG